MRSWMKQRWRSVLKWAAENKSLQEVAQKYGYSVGFAKRWVCGPTVDDAVRAIKHLNSIGVYATTTLLGESHEKVEDIEPVMEVWMDLIEKIHKEKLKSHISIKLTQFGYDIDLEVCKKNTERILKKTKEYGIFTRIDMEFAYMTQGTIDIHKHFYDMGYTNFAMVFQANLRRTLKDIEYVNANKFRIRWTKGVYAESPEVSYQVKSEIDKNYEAGLNMLMKDGSYPSVATHDWKLINLAKELAVKYGREKHQFEFQRVYGVHADEILKSTIGEGYRVCLTVPMGTHWYPYYTRRLAENWTNIFDIPLCILGLKKFI
jgi:proline dehydrogenase